MMIVRGLGPSLNLRSSIGTWSVRGPPPPRQLSLAREFGSVGES